MDISVYGNQRKGSRIPFNNNIRFTTDQFSWHLGRARNISRSGIFVETEELSKVGSKIYMNFRIKDNLQNIKATGELVRVVGAEEKVLGRESSGIGIKFSLLPSEDLVIRSFVRGVVNNSVPVRSSSLHQSVEYTSKNVKAENPLISTLKWWFKEAVAKVLKLNHLIFELLLLAIVLIVFKVLFSR